MKTRWFLGLLLGALAASAWAASETPPAEAEGTKDAATPATPTPKKAADAAPAPKEDEASKEAEETPEAAEVFVPTETISEDIAVPFPVDI